MLPGDITGDNINSTLAYTPALPHMNCRYQRLSLEACSADRWQHGSFLLVMPKERCPGMEDRYEQAHTQYCRDNNHMLVHGSSTQYDGTNHPD